MGFINAIILIIKNKYLPLAFTMLGLSIIILVIGGLMRLFLTM
jgi:hypothetical protein